MTNSLTDDQIAQLGCLVAFLAAIGVTALSYWLGSARKSVERMTVCPAPGLSAASQAARAAIATASRRKAA